MTTADDDTLLCPGCGAEQPVQPLVAGSADAPSCPDCAASWVVCDRYALTGQLGRGGMGVVYSARDLQTDDTDGEAPEHELAVKIVGLTGHRPGAGDWKGYELFERSSRVLQELAPHPGLPAVHAFAEGDNGAFVLVREAFAGGSLAERISEQRRILDGPRLDRLFRDLLQLLAFLQQPEPPVVHRDIKPENIMFRTEEDWQPVLVDFDTVARPDNTGETLVGTPGYAAPEQLLGETSPSSDVFGLGTTMLFAATHRPPDQLQRQRGRYQLDGLLDNLDSVWRDVLPGMVEPAVEDRFVDAQAVLTALERPASTESGDGAASAPRRWHKLVWLATPLMVALAVFLLVRSDPSSERIGERFVEGVRDQGQLIPVGVFDGHKAFPQELDISDDGRLVISGDFRGHLILWERASGRVLWRHQLEDAIRSVDIDSKGERVACTESDFARDQGFVHVYDAATGRELWRDRQVKSTGPKARFSGDGQRVYSDNYGQYIRVYDAITGERDDRQMFNPHSQHSPADFIIRGDLLATAGYDDQVHVFRLPGWQTVRSWSGPTTSYRAIDLSPDGRIVAAVEKRGDLWIWSVETGELLHHVPDAHVEKPNDVALSPDGRYLVTVGRDLRVLLWSVANGQKLHHLEPHNHKVDGVAWHATGHLIVTGGRDRKVRLWTGP